jgi:YbgC/YbaW family acyl-CoA thioester hydrolase
MYHNTAAFRFVEVAETAMLDRLGFLDDVYGRLPRVHIEADFERPLRFRDLVDIRLWVDSVGATSVTYGFEMSCDGETAVRGRAVAVLLTTAEGKPTNWSDAHRELLLSAGPQAPELLTRG